MAIPAFDAVSTQELAGGGTSMSWTHTAGSGNNRIAVIRLGTRHDISAATATYGGSAATLLEQEAYPNSTNAAENWVWYFIAPPPGASTVALSWTTDCVLGRAECTTYDNVDQSRPFGTPVKDNGDEGGSTSTLSLNVSSQSGELVIDSLSTLQADALTVGAGQTSRYNNVTSILRTGGSDEPGDATVTMSWQATNVEQWSYIAVPLLPVAGAQRVIKYLHNTIMSHLAGRTLILDILGRQIPLEQIEFDNWIRTDGPFFPTAKRYASAVEDPATAYIEGLRIRGDRATIETVKEAMFVSLLNRLARSA